MRVGIFFTAAQKCDGLDTLEKVIFRFNIFDETGPTGLLRFIVSFRCIKNEAFNFYF